MPGCTLPEGRHVFTQLTVEENIRIGSTMRHDKTKLAEDFERILGNFPFLRGRLSTPAGKLSGGEQQQLVIGRALMTGAKLILLDEPSLGLAPMITQDLFRRLADFNKEFGTTMFVVEQNASLALSLASRAYVLEAGEIVLSGNSEDLLHDDDVRKAYLGF